MSSETPNPQPSRFVWYELHTFDADAATTFYKNVLGWGTQDAGMPGGPYTLVSVGDLAIGGILERPKDSFVNGQQPGWRGFIGVDDVDRVSKRVQEAGGSVKHAPQDIPGVGRFAVVADPQGAVFLLFQPSNTEQEPQRASAGTPGSAAWHDLAAIDWESDFRFYADLFGWSKAQAVEMGPNAIYQIFAVGSEPIGGMMNRMDPSQSPGWLFYFNVDEIGAAVARVKQSGGTIIHGPSEVPGGQQIAHCVDPQGGIFGIVGPNS